MGGADDREAGQRELVHQMPRRDRGHPAFRKSRQLATGAPQGGAQHRLQLGIVYRLGTIVEHGATLARAGERIKNISADSVPAIFGTGATPRLLCRDGGDHHRTMIVRMKDAMLP
jgi:hypothetical protein